ncbi:MAG: TetR/AcrR family transcriptional regulator [Desulfuromonadales bacterium]|nr:TetR/AcrR family transcriptional regulator [Desulfuromonadales bacterium]
MTSRSRKQIILKEAASLFREKGYLASTLRELARRAGVQGGSIYHHFSSKQEILFLLMDNTMNDMIERLSTTIAELDCPLARLRHAIRLHIEYHIFGPDETYITEDELRNLDTENYRRIIAKRDRYQQIFEEIIADGKARLNWQVSDVKLFARAIIQMCAGVTRWYKTNDTFSIDEIAEQYFNLLLTGLRERPAEEKQTQQL